LRTRTLDPRVILTLTNAERSCPCWPARSVDTLKPMRTRQPLTTPARTALRLVGLLVVLVGLFGMHGLANHGVGGMDMPHAVIAEESTAMAGSTFDLLSAGLPHQVLPLVERAYRAAELGSGPGHKGMGMNMAGLCVAILAIGLVALLLLLRGGRAPRASWSLQRLMFAVTPLGRDPAPPSLTALSIQRC